MWSQVEVDADGGVIGDGQSALAVDLGAGECTGGALVGQQVVDAPPAVELASLPSVGPPRVRSVAILAASCEFRAIS